MPLPPPWSEPSSPTRDAASERSHRARDRSQQSAERRRADDGRVERERRHAAGRRAAELALDDRREPLHQQAAGEHAHERRAGADNQRFDEQQPGDGDAARPERTPDGDFLLPPRRANQEEARDVGERDQQHEAGGDRDRTQNRPQTLDVGRVRGLQVGAPLGVRHGGARPHQRRDAIGRHTGQHALAQPDHVGVRRCPQRYQHFRVGVQMPEVGRHHADDRERLRFVRTVAHVRVELAPDDGRVSSVSRAPQTVADEGDIRAAGIERVVVESTADRRLDPEALHEARRHPGSRDRLRPLAANQREDIEIPRDGMLDDIVERPPIERLKVGRRRLSCRAIPDRVQPLGRRIGQRPEEIRVEHEEHGRTERDPQAERNDRCEGKARRLGQTAGGDAEFGQHRGSIAKTRELGARFRRPRPCRTPKAVTGGGAATGQPGTLNLECPRGQSRLSVPELSSSERGGGGGRICSR